MLDGVTEWILIVVGRACCWWEKQTYLYARLHTFLTYILVIFTIPLALPCWLYREFQGLSMVRVYQARGYSEFSPIDYERNAVAARSRYRRRDRLGRVNWQKEGF
jgi:hypothetical protein